MGRRWSSVREAYILIETEMVAAAGKTVAGALPAKPGAVAADVVTGSHHVIALVQGVDADAVARIVINDVQATEGVRHTTTGIALGSSSRGA
jgi:DNA-binding Lrp family transcriptional regulator